MAAAMNFAAAERQLHAGSKGYGQYIFAYCNTRNNRVLYSLTRHLDSKKALKQLYDAGANNNPPALRRHDWRPLWTLSLPGSPAGRNLGLAAFERLREWRILHETSWEPPEFFHRKRGKEEIEEMEKKLDERGGSKRESVYDVIKHEQHKLRARMVMDQKANSIADLAAVLLWQHDEARLVVDGSSPRDVEIAEMLQLADGVERGLLQKLQKRRLLTVRRANFYKQKGANRPEVQQNLDKIVTKYQRALFAARALAQVDPDRKARLKAFFGDEVLQKGASQSQSKVNSVLKQYETSAERRINKCQKAEKALEAKLEGIAEDAKADRVRASLRRRLEKDRAAADALTECKASIVDAYNASPADHREALDRLLRLARAKIDAQVAARKAREGGMLPIGKMWQELTRNSILRGDLDLYGFLYDPKAAPSQTEAVSTVESEAGPEAESPEAAAPNPVSNNSRSGNAPASESPATTSSTPLTTEFLRANLPSFPPSLDLARQVLKEKTVALEGADVSWANILDAEYAEAWPETTRHAPMGKARHAAPAPKAEPLMELPPHPQPDPEDGKFGPEAFGKRPEHLVAKSKPQRERRLDELPSPDTFLKETFDRIGREIHAKEQEALT